MRKKYVRYKGGTIDVLPIKGHHLESRAKVKKKALSAGRFKTKDGKVTTYSKSFGIGIFPAKKDAQKIQKKLYGEKDNK